VHYCFAERKNRNPPNANTVVMLRGGSLLYLIYYGEKKCSIAEGELIFFYAISYGEKVVVKRGGLHIL